MMIVQGEDRPFGLELIVSFSIFYAKMILPSYGRHGHGSWAGDAVRRCAHCARRPCRALVLDQGSVDWGLDLDIAPVVASRPVPCAPSAMMATCWSKMN